MGEVYRARDTRLGRDVAIKVLPPEFADDPERLRRFEQEARAVAALSHPNVLALFDVGSAVVSLRGAEGPEAISAQTPGLPRPPSGLAVTEGEPVHFLVTELLEGESLRDRLKAGGLTVRKAVETAVQIAQGLAAAHEKGIVHRDLKPGNVFVTKDGQVKILDFGLARLSQPEIPSDPHATTLPGEPATESGAVLGTMGYTSPEQLRGERADARSDIFAFGCVLYEMLAGTSPFLKVTGAETVTAIMSEDPAPLSGTGRVIAPALQEIVSRCLEKRQADRFSSAHDLALALRACSGISETLAAVPARARPASRRRWAAVGAVLVVFVATALLGVRLFRRSSPAAPPAASPSIAVLPFTNLSGDKEQEYFSDGLSEELMGLLTKVKQLHVAGRTSSFAFKGKTADLADIGRRLHVATVLEGSVRRSGDRLRVAAELVSVADGFQLWAETYDRTMSDAFAVQDDIAGAVVAALRVTLLPQERPAASQHGTMNPEAHAQYLLGRHFVSGGNRESWRRAVAAYEAAIQLDPGYAAAYAGLAGAAADLAGFASTTAEREASEQKARAALAKALALDPTLPGAYGVRGYMRTNMEFPPDREGARRDFEHVLALDPGNVGARSELAELAGNLPEAIAEARKVVDLDPLSGYAWMSLGWDLCFSGDLRGSRKALEMAVEISPDNMIARWCLGITSLLEGNPKAALLEFGRTPEEFRLMGTAMAEHDLGHPGESRQALEELIAKYSGSMAYQIAEAWAWCGATDKAFEWLERSYAQRDTGLHALDLDPCFARLRSDPRYQDLLRRMKFPASTTP